MGIKTNHKQNYIKSLHTNNQLFTKEEYNSKITVIFPNHILVYFNTNDKGKRKKEKGEERRMQLNKIPN